MVTCTCVRGSTLSRLAMVLVLLSIGNTPALRVMHQYVEPAVNRQPGFRRELVEQITSFIMNSQNSLHGELLKHKFRNPEVFIRIFYVNSKISSIFQHFGEEALGLLTKVSSSSEADTDTKSNFNMI